MQLYSLNTVVRTDDGGAPHIGIYWIEDRMVHVAYVGALPWKAAASGTGSACGLAQQLLGEFIHGE